MIERQFQSLHADADTIASNREFHINPPDGTEAWYFHKSWNQLLKKDRVLLIGETGVGKTYECKHQATRMNKQGKPAFYLRLADLPETGVSRMLMEMERKLFEVWNETRSSIATFFLDSIDEVNFKTLDLELTVKFFLQCLNDSLKNVRIIITSRPQTIDLEFLRRHLPVHYSCDRQSFAKFAMGESRETWDQLNSKLTNWNSYELLPLTRQQKIEIVDQQFEHNSYDVIKHHEALDTLLYIDRPQDVIQLCTDYNSNNTPKVYTDQVDEIISTKMVMNPARREIVQLSYSRVYEGVSRLALALQLTGKTRIMAIGFSLPIEQERNLLDPIRILRDWTNNDIEALLQRPIFKLSSSNSLVFHSSELQEYLAAHRLSILRKNGIVVSIQMISKLLGVGSSDVFTDRMPNRKMILWLAHRDHDVLELIRSTESRLLFYNGDPTLLTHSERLNVIEVFCAEYGNSFSKGIQPSLSQIQKFATVNMIDRLCELCDRKFINHEVRLTLLELLEAALSKCDSGKFNTRKVCEVAYTVTVRPNDSVFERMIGMRILLIMKDKRISSIVQEIVLKEENWPVYLFSDAVQILYPKYMSSNQLVRYLANLDKEQYERYLSDRIRGLIFNMNIGEACLEQLRSGIVELLSNDMKLRNRNFNLTKKYSHLGGLLADLCCKGLHSSANEAWLEASIYALHSRNRQDNGNQPHSQLMRGIAELSGRRVARLFLREVELLNIDVNSNNYYELIERTVVYSYRGIVPTFKRDFDAILEIVADKSLKRVIRLALMYVACLLIRHDMNNPDKMKDILKVATDDTEVLRLIEEQITRFKSELSSERQNIISKQDRREKRNKNFESWERFYDELRDKLQEKFSDEHKANTTYNLWRVLSNCNNIYDYTKWNRKFIEQHLGLETANFMREALSDYWRDRDIELPSQMNKTQHDIVLTGDGMALTGIEAEAEDPQWVSSLEEREAEKAIRYSLLSANDLPKWLNDLAKTYEKLVGKVIGREVFKQMDMTIARLDLLQKLKYSSSAVGRLVVSYLSDWLIKRWQLYERDDSIDVVERIRQIRDITLKHGDKVTISKLCKFARRCLRHGYPSELRLIWLSVVFQCNPREGVNALTELTKRSDELEASFLIKFFGTVFSSVPSDNVSLHDERFTPRILYSLVKFVFAHVKVEDDSKHDGLFEPNIRYDAEEARSRILNAFLSSAGNDALKLKIRFQNSLKNPLLHDYVANVTKDKHNALSEGLVYTEKHLEQLEKLKEIPICSNYDMHFLLQKRMEDLDILLKSDGSPREGWTNMPLEKHFRNSIGTFLNERSNSIYKVDYESVTGEEKRTDIRLKSTISDYEGVIEVKLGDNYSAKQLIDTINSQLVTKYLDHPYRKSGVLLVVINKKTRWKYSKVSKSPLSVVELRNVLEAEASRIQAISHGELKLGVHFLDLRSPEDSGS